MPQSTLEVDEHPQFERRFHRVQRMGWALLVLLVASALLGVTGRGGPLARAEAAGDGLRVDYPRFARNAAEAEIRATVAAGAVADGGYTLEFTGPWRRALRIESIEPRPQAMRADAHAIVLEFAAGDAGDQRVRLHVALTGPGVEHAGLGLAGRAPARLRSVVWP